MHSFVYVNYTLGFKKKEKREGQDTPAPGCSEKDAGSLAPITHTHRDTVCVYVHVAKFWSRIHKKLAVSGKAASPGAWGRKTSFPCTDPSTV